MKPAIRIFAALYRSYLWHVVGIALVLALLGTSAFAAQPLTGTFRGAQIGRRVTFTKPGGGVVNDFAGVLKLQLDQQTPGDGKGPTVPVFCIELNVLVRVSDRYVSDGPVTTLPGGCQIRYLLDKYPASTANTANEAAARQLAIWHFSDAVDLTTIQDAAVQSRAVALANEAITQVALNGCPAMQATVAALTLSPPSATVLAGQAATYTVQVTPANAAQSVVLQVNGTATFANELQQITLPLSQGAASFSVTGASSGTSTVSAILPYQLDAGTVFSPIDAGRLTQRLVLAEHMNLSASASAQTIVGPGTTATATTLATTPPATATPATPTPASAPSPNATATPALPTAPPNATPTTRHSSSPKRTPTAPPLGSPNAPTVTPGGPTLTPGVALDQTPATTPSETGGPLLTPLAGSPSESAGVASVPRPSQLPNTGAPIADTRPAWLLTAALLLACGLLLRQRSIRR